VEVEFEERVCEARRVLAAETFPAHNFASSRHAQLSLQRHFVTMPKRRKQDNLEDETESTPRKSRRTANNDSPATSTTATPSNRKSILRGTPSKLNGKLDPTPKSIRKVLFSTPAEEADAPVENGATPTAVRNDRSARRKSARTLQKESVGGDDEDEEEDQDVQIAEAILNDHDAASEEDDIFDVPDDVQPSTTAETPSKRGRGRPKGRPKKERTPSPPPNLPPHELYFFQNRTGANKTSSNTLPSGVLLNHEDYQTHISSYNDPHANDILRLEDLHKRAFEQWTFELEESFNICLYGYGSKRKLAMEFVDYMYHAAPKAPKIVIVNGYTPGLTIRDVFTTLASAVLPKTTKLPAQPPALLDLILSHLTETPPAQSIRLVIHSLDHAILRKHQALIARLAAHPSISLLATADTPHFALLWDTALLRQFNWLYHDATTFQPYTAELDVVEEVNALLGRSGRRLGGKDGVIFVLRSLPENARNLFRILVAEQLVSIGDGDIQRSATVPDDDDDDILGASDEEAAASEQNTPSRRKRGRKPKKATPAKKAAPVPTAQEGVEYRTLYHKAVEEFVCSSELNFRTLLKEFHDHQMLESRKDALGTERLVVPMGMKELESLLEELV
jgi:origin recognition complex subunit 2